MESLARALFLALLLCSSAQSQMTVTSADCAAVETDAGVALDLINKHRTDGYLFSLFRVADAHEQHTGNSSFLYLTLDVLETMCSVLSGKHWESCTFPDLYSLVFGQCKVIMYTNKEFKKNWLYGYNCTTSSVPYKLTECKHCSVRAEFLEDVEAYRGEAEQALEKYNDESNHTKYFKVDKVEKAIRLAADRQEHSIEFSIKETRCSKSTSHVNVSECDFLDDAHAHVGFCQASLLVITEGLDAIDISCEIYDTLPGRHPFLHHHCHFYRSGCRHPPADPSQRHHHQHHHFDCGHHHRHVHQPRCPPPPDGSQIHPEGAAHHNSSEEGPGCRHPSAGPSQRRHHKHHHSGHGHYHRHVHQPRCPPPPGGSQIHSEGPELHHNSSEKGPGCRHPPAGPSQRRRHKHHHSGHGHHHRHVRRSRSPPPPDGNQIHPEGAAHHNSSEEGPGCRHPPAGPSQRRRHKHHHSGHGHHHRQVRQPRCPPPPGGSQIHSEGPELHHNSPEEEGHHQHSSGGLPPPLPSHGPHALPPAPGEVTPPPVGPYFPPPPHDTSLHLPLEPPPHAKERHSKEHVFSPIPESVHRIPVLNEQDSLLPPTINFPEHSTRPHDPLGRDQESSLLDRSPNKKPSPLDFPLHLSQSASCPGKPKYDKPLLLSLFPPRLSK
ncbi:PREDICTED: histidine-rich glycoprotein [Crocodylus porosus]|uniref:histidine-rich glycoprotein n=1 Tax=Crocodylus porosus TaxID=8502 RepID=UPI00093F5644|nr:PREDICTED: histidine-rich glycoprotein [Crocodylus porosus]